MALDHPWTTPPAPGDVVDVAPGIGWLRMPLPFQLNHINLWLIADDSGRWCAVDTGMDMGDVKQHWETLIAQYPLARQIVTHYHPDHLGTTSYTSTLSQDLVQHERYFTFGELWRGNGEQEETDLSRPDGDRREWLFTSKEWDVDTSLYYFGARYFDPHMSVWQNPDPLLAGLHDDLVTPVEQDE